VYREGPQRVLESAYRANEDTRQLLPQMGQAGYDFQGGLRDVGSRSMGFASRAAHDILETEPPRSLTRSQKTGALCQNPVAQEQVAIYGAQKLARVGARTFLEHYPGMVGQPAPLEEVTAIVDMTHLFKIDNDPWAGRLETVVVKCQWIIRNSGLFVTGPNGQPFREVPDLFGLKRLKSLGEIRVELLLVNASQHKSHIVAKTAYELRRRIEAKWARCIRSRCNTRQYIELTFPKFGTE
jgi:hypothetical protein